MHTETITLQSGRVVTLAQPDLYALVATDIDIPNQALVDITDLIVYGAMLHAGTKEQERLLENKRFIRAEFEVAALVCHEPKLILKGDVPDGALTPRDLTMRDLTAIVTFFQTGGSVRVPTPANTEPDGGTQADSAGQALEQAAE